MKNMKFIELFEERGIETVEQIIYAIEKGQKNAQINITQYENKIEGLILLIAVEQQKIDRTKKLMTAGDKALKTVKAFKTA